MNRRVLVIEDNAALVASVFAFLEVRGYELDVARDGVSGAHLATAHEYDAIILDWMLPRLAGPEVLKQLRDRGLSVPIIMLTARDELPDKIAGFKAGADDYLTKPFALAELEVRLEALIARSKGRANVLQVGDLRFNLTTQEVARGATQLRLHPACRKLLEALMRGSPAVVPRRNLETALWGNDPPDNDILRSHIHDLRKILDGPFSRKMLHTMPKLGYRLAASGADA
jgi:DNA-binding response OmpR family regulator